MDSSTTIQVEPVALSQEHAEWLPGRNPYEYQYQVFQCVQEAFQENETVCIFLVTPTGSGKTLASYAYPLLARVPALGVYPTNELIRDQESTLKAEYERVHGKGEWFLRIDSKQLDDWALALGSSSHSKALETLMNWRWSILTNPDILFYITFGKYPDERFRSHLFRSLADVYRLFVFDEFHLYNVKQMADMVYLAGALHAINPKKGRVFIFASATPQIEAVHWLQDRLHLKVRIIESQPADTPDARRIAHPVQLTLLPSDLNHWKGWESFHNFLPSLQAFVATHNQARIVTIFDSVAQTMNLAQSLRNIFPDKPVGEVHGFSSDLERETATRLPITVGTTTIEVGIDFKGATEKDVLIFEARTASQFIQRFGRLARHEKASNIPNWIIALVPEYVYNFLSNDFSGRESISRARLYDKIYEAYLETEEFSRYLTTHALAEFHHAIQFTRRLFQADVLPNIQPALEDVLESLTTKTIKEAYARHRQYQEERIIEPLLSFRGSGFEGAILDERGTDAGFPIKRYDILFLLRRGVFCELDEEEFFSRVLQQGEKWHEALEREKRFCKPIGLKPEDLLGVYGFFALNNMLEKGRKVWFEIDEEAVYGRKGQVTTVTGLEIMTDPPTKIQRLNKRLRRKEVVCWFIDQHPTSIRLGRSLPPLFGIHELRIVRSGLATSKDSWSIAFNQEAFLVDSLGWYKQIRNDRAIIT